MLRYENDNIKNVPIKIENLLKESNSNDDIKTILIKGGPGSGKSTLLTKLAYDWA